MQAIYFQKSKVVQEEFKLIELTTLREVVVENLKGIINEVKEQRRELDDATMIETFSLFIKLREATVELIRAISIWQESFTGHIRPTLMECDYVIERLVKDIDFINGSSLRKVFNFQFFRGNVLLLPYPNQKTVPHEKVSSQLAEQIRIFSNPEEEVVVYCYQFLINCLPEDVYKKVVSLKDWLMSAWVPRIWVADLVRGIKKREARGALVADNNNNNSNNSNNNNDEGMMSPNGKNVGGGGGGGGGGGFNKSTPKLLSINTTNEEDKGIDQKTLSPSENKAKILEQLRSNISSRTLTRSSTGGVAVDAGETDKKRRKSSLKMMKRMRRNQMLAEETEKILKITTNTAAAAAAKEEQDRLEAEALKEVEEQVVCINEEEKQEIAKVEFYYQEMEKLFIPKVGRRAVQTLAITGMEGRVREETDFLFNSPSKMFYLHSTTSMQQALDNIVNSQEVTESSKRTEGNLIAKRNRLLNDRNAGLKGNKDYSAINGIKRATTETNLSLDIPSTTNEEDGKDDDDDAASADNRSIDEHSVQSAEQSVDDNSVADSDFKGNLASSALSLNEEDNLKKTDKRRLSKMSSSRRLSDLTVTFSEFGESVEGVVAAVAVTTGGGNGGNEPAKNSKNRKENKSDGKSQIVPNSRSASHKNKNNSNNNNNESTKSIAATASSSSVSVLPSIHSLKKSGTSISGIFSATATSSSSVNNTASSGGVSPTVDTSRNSMSAGGNGSERVSTKQALDLSGSVAKKKKPFVKASQTMKLSTSDMREMYLKNSVATSKVNILNLG